MKIMKTYIKPETVIIKMEALTLLAGAGGDAKRYHTVLDDASPVGLSLYEDNGDDDMKWY